MPEPEQLELIDVTPENARKIKSLIRRRDDANAEHLAFKQKADELDLQIMEEVKKTGAKPDNEGVWRVKVGDTTIEIAPGKAKLKIREKDNDKEEEVEEPDEETKAEGAEQASRRRRPAVVPT